MQRIKAIVILLFFIAGCRESYEPPAIKAPNRYLVVDGIINMQTGSITSFQLSKTKNLLDSLAIDPERGAEVSIEARGGASYPMQEQSAGLYATNPLSLTYSDQYRLRIRTADGSTYLSDYVTAKKTPPIENLSWQQNEDVTIYVDTKDPTNNARYYRWDYVETWHYRAPLEGNFGLGLSNGVIFQKDINTQTTNCWQTMLSTEIVLASSVRLNEDVIAQFPVAVIPKNSEKIAIRYSALVRQYALTEEAYRFWDILRKNSQTLGTLFDAQPGQLSSNLYNVSNAAEPVIGFISAGNVEEKRIFINRAELTNWQPPVPNLYCGEAVISQDPQDPFRWNYPDTTYEPWHFVSPSGIRIAKKDCLDCRRRGGTNQKPFFW